MFNFINRDHVYGLVIGAALIGSMAFFTGCDADKDDTADTGESTTTEETTTPTSTTTGTGTGTTGTGTGTTGT